MNFLTNKAQEFFSNFWIKTIALIPLCFFNIDEREKIVIFALLVIMILDLFLGMMKASFIDKDFDWSLMGKKFSKKFVLFFVFLLASYVLSKAFSLVNFWFYMATGLVCFSEFGSMAKKAQALGLPIRSDIVEQIKNRGESFFLGLIAEKTVTVETVTESFEKHKAEDLKTYNTEKAIAVRAGNIERAAKEAEFVKKEAKKREKFISDKKSIDG